MSTTILQTVIRDNGVLTDPDGNIVTIIAPGVIRTDTSGVVLAPGNMTRVSMGVYQSVVSDPAYDLTYEYSVTFTVGSILQGPLQISVAGTKSVTPGSIYSNLAYWQKFAGSINLQLYDDKDSTGTFDPVGVQMAMDFADGEISQALGAVYALPLTPIPVKARYWAAVIGVGQWLYPGGYGLADGDKTGDKFSKLVDRVRLEMRRALNPPNLLPCALRTGISFGVTAFDPVAARNARPPTPERIWSPEYGRWRGGW